MRIGFDAMPLPLVLVRCKRCHKTAGLFSAAAERCRLLVAQGPHRRCRCDPPPRLPEGAELDGLVAQAWRCKMRDERGVLPSSYTVRPPAFSAAFGPHRPT